MVQRGLTRGLDRVEEVLVRERRALREVVGDGGGEEKDEDEPDEEDPARDRQPEHQANVLPAATLLPNRRSGHMGIS